VEPKRFRRRRTHGAGGGDDRFTLLGVRGGTLRVGKDGRGAKVCERIRTDLERGAVDPEWIGHACRTEIVERLSQHDQRPLQAALHRLLGDADDARGLGSC
jgi:hypothetical protein